VNTGSEPARLFAEVNSGSLAIASAIIAGRRQQAVRQARPAADRRALDAGGLAKPDVTECLNMAVRQASQLTVFCCEEA
jgi:hypothetical protein